MIGKIIETSEPSTPDMRLATAIHKYQRSEISQEKAAELAQLNRRYFLEAVAREKRDVFKEWSRNNFSLNKFRSAKLVK